MTHHMQTCNRQISQWCHNNSKKYSPQLIPLFIYLFIHTSLTKIDQSKLRGFYFVFLKTRSKDKLLRAHTKINLTVHWEQQLKL